MKLEVGMYVRTKYGITQYREYETDKGQLLCMPLTNGTFANIEDVLKASNNILDLIKPGDYVNGYLVTTVSKDAYGETIVFVGQRLIEEAGYYRSYYSKDIKTIVTKEQFESVEYEVE